MSPTLISRLSSDHRSAPGATEEEIDAAEARLGLELPLQLIEVLRASNGADLWEDADFPCRLLSTSELDRPSTFVHSDGPEGLLAIMRVGSADCLAMQTDRFSSTFGKVFDCFHETFPHELHGVADSVSELLQLAFDSGGREWVWPAVLAHGVDYARR